MCCLNQVPRIRIIKAEGIDIRNAIQQMSSQSSALASTYKPSTAIKGGINKHCHNVGDSDGYFWILSEIMHELFL